jgi:signal transduction histidine kinase/ActR/RegA family two-component response regulator
MRRLRPHRLAVLVLGLVVAAAAVASGGARKVVDENEDQLLRERTAEVASLLESLGSGYEAEIASVAAVAEVTDGDPAQFARAVTSVDEGAGTPGNGTWALLRRSAGAWTVTTALGEMTPLADFSPEATAALEDAAQGRFVVVGFLGEGLSRRLGMATGRPSVGGDLVVYTETGLLAATASATADGAADGAEVAEEDNPIAGLAARVFIGEEPDPDTLLLAVGEFDDSHVASRLVDVAGTTVFLQVSPTEALGGSLALALPRILFWGLVLLGLSLAGVVETVQRRRDDAVRKGQDLERQNALLDQALHDQRLAESARANLEAELRQAQRLEAVGHLAGGVAHDFNNVLAAILSYADLASDATDDPDLEADLRAIQHAARRGADLTRKLLQFSRRRPGEVMIVDVNDRVADVTGMLGRTLGEDVSLRTALASHPTTALVDPVELDQVLLNLVVNARDAVSPGGTITIATEVVALAAADAEVLAGADPGRYVRLTVADDGAGMDPEVIEHAFEPFFTTKGRGEGTGLGLSTVYGIVQRHGGRVSAHSTPGEGTTIEVLLPLSEEDVAAPAAIESPTASGDGDGRTILVVEDEEDLRRALRRMLEHAGFRVLDAPDGSVALERHTSAHVDLLLTDVIMPKGVTGVDVAEGFRSRDTDLPVVFVTGYSDDILEPGSLDGGRTSLLQKPFSEADLLEAVDHALAART